jgi:hypothetical protein
MSTLHTVLIPLFAATGFTAAETPNLTNYGWIEMVARLGVAGLSMLGLILLTTRTYPRRDREKDEAQTLNIKAILASSEEKMKIVMQGTANANDKVCQHLTELQKAVTDGNSDHKELLIAILTGKDLSCVSKRAQNQNATSV